jgi:molybdopterin-guanine dinucleotide biosynthesis protein A
MLSRAGWVLAGGSSKRMGSDKALLPWNGATLVEHVAGRVREAAGSVTLVGRPERYAHLPIPAIPDLRGGAGPLAGIEAALLASQAGWNLVVACDMPSVTVEVLTGLLDAACRAEPGCVVPAAASGRVHPLCAVYHRSCGPVFTVALDRGVRRMTDALELVHTVRIPGVPEEYFANLNDRNDLAQHRTR